MAKHRKYNGGSGKSALEYRNSMNAKQVKLNQIGGKIFNLPFQSTGGSDPSTKTATELEQTKMQTASYAKYDADVGGSGPAPVPAKGGGKRKSRKSNSRKGKSIKERKKRTRRNKKSRKSRSRK
jgi:hypothetical protein